MATTTFNTRISLKYDTYANWVEKDPVLLAGELAVVVVPAATGAVAKEPAILFKAGDGSSKFSQLQFAAGLAADVYDWVHLFIYGFSPFFAYAKVSRINLGDNASLRIIVTGIYIEAVYNYL